MGVSGVNCKITKPCRSEQDDDVEESDEYEVADEDGEDDDDDDDDETDEDGDEEKEEGGGGLTALLLGSHGDDDEDKGWVPDGGREPADYSGDEDNEQALEGAKIPTPQKPPSKNVMAPQSKGAAVESPKESGKKRARDEESEDHNGKKLKKV